MYTHALIGLTLFSAHVNSEVEISNQTECNKSEELTDEEFFSL